MITMLYAIVGIPLTLLCIANIGSLLANTFRYAYIQFNTQLNCSSDFFRRLFGKKRGRNMKGNALLAHYLYNTALAYGNVTNGNGKHENTTLETITKETLRQRRKQKIRIPFHVILISFILYVCLGAYMFSAWEGWEFLEGLYFCFITLSTIVCFN